MQIYYFSGTGNSLHVAKELKRRFPEATTRGRYHHSEVSAEDIAGQKH